MTATALYLRLSDEDRNKVNKTDASESIQNQLSMLREYCSERNWDIYDIYCDEDLSGADKNRPEFNRLLKDCEDGKIDVVLCKSQSRFSREMEMIEKYLHDKFIEWGVRFISIIDHADTNDVHNKKARQINGLVNEWYLEELSENIRQTLKHKRMQGEFTGSFAPYGYLIDPENKNHLIVDENTAPIVRQIFEWYNGGWGYRRIVMELNERKIPSPTLYKKQRNSKYRNLNIERSCSFGLWTQSTIYDFLRNETYTGTLVQGKSHNISYKNKKRKKERRENWIRVPDCHDAIIDEEMWQATQERLKSRTRVPKTSSELTPLSGKIKCALCGSAMRRNVYYNKDKSLPKCNYLCGTYFSGAMNCPNISSINGELLENAIVEEINKLISKYCQMDELDIIDDRKKKIEAYRLALKDYQNRIKTINRKLENLYEDKLEGLLTKQQYISLKEKYTKEIAEFEGKYEETEKDIKVLENAEKEVFDKKEIIKKYTHIDKLTREIAEEFIDAVYIGEKIKGEEREIIINWKI